MHSEIRAFWEIGGREVVCVDKPTDYLTNTPAYLVDGMIVACPYEGHIVYYFRGQWLFEKYMLRLVRLKAFL